jgi:hypothetical protein
MFSVRAATAAHEKLFDCQGRTGGRCRDLGRHSRARRKNDTNASDLRRRMYNLC